MLGSPQIRKIRAGDRQISARGWNAMADAVNGGVSAVPPPLLGNYSAAVTVQNDTGADREMFECISLDDPLWELQEDGSVDLIFSGQVADADKPAAILLEPIAHDATNKRCGRALIFGLAYAKVGPAASSSILKASPDPTNHRLEPNESGTVTLLAAPDTSAEKLLPVLLGVSGDSGATINTGWARTPPTGIPAATDDGTDLTPGAASCELMEYSGGIISPVSPTQNVTIRSQVVGATIAGDVVVEWVEKDGEKFVVVGNCETD